MLDLSFLTYIFVLRNIHLIPFSFYQTYGSKKLYFNSKKWLEQQTSLLLLKSCNPFSLSNQTEKYYK